MKMLNKVTIKNENVEHMFNMSCVFFFNSVIFIIHFLYELVMMGKYNVRYIVVVFSRYIKMLNKITMESGKWCKMFIFYISFLYGLYNC